MFGIDFHNGMPWISIADEYDQIGPAPLCLFEIVDPRVPATWQARKGPGWSLSIAPPAFHEPGFNEDLLEQLPEAVAAFREVRDELLRHAN